MLDITQLIDLAIAEDIGEGDHSSLATISTEAIGKASIFAKCTNGIIAGIEEAILICSRIDSNLKLTAFKKDGDKIKKGDKILTIEGNSQKILQAERLILNFMQRMSGIATTTATYVEKIADLPTKLLDTRKTTPLMRFFEKKAVKIGGGENHRFGLFDMIMIKDNHIDFAGGIEKAITKTLLYLKKANKKIKIEIEVRSFEELNQVLQTGGVHRIMLDNFTPQMCKEAVEIIYKQYETEASGGITLENIRQYALSGVDFISVGALTHQINSLDLSMLVEI